MFTRMKTKIFNTRTLNYFFANGQQLNVTICLCVEQIVALILMTINAIAIIKCFKCHN